MRKSEEGLASWMNAESLRVSKRCKRYSLAADAGL